jgi:hypothetical protein
MEEAQVITVGVLRGFQKDRFTRNCSLADTTASTAPIVGLFELPRHLMIKWAALIGLPGQSGNAREVSPESFAEFARAIVEFLRFKEVELPDGCRCNLVQVQSGVTALGDEIDNTVPEQKSFRLIINLGLHAVSIILGMEEKAGRIVLESGQGYALQRTGSDHGTQIEVPGLTLLFVIGSD